jgi:hypothetical protein
LHPLAVERLRLRERALQANFSAALNEALPAFGLVNPLPSLELLGEFQPALEITIPKHARGKLRKISVARA